MSRVWDSLRKAEEKRAADDARDRATGSSGERSASDRRSCPRLKQEMRILVHGMTPERRAFREEAPTVNISEGGCLLEVEAPLQSRQRLFLTNATNQAEVECRVVYVGRRVHGKTLAGVQFPRPTQQFWSLAQTQ